MCSIYCGKAYIFLHYQVATKSCVMLSVSSPFLQDFLILPKDDIIIVIPGVPLLIHGLVPGYSLSKMEKNMESRN